MDNIQKKIELQLLDDADFQRDYYDFLKKKEEYISHPLSSTKTILKIAYTKVYQDLKLCKVGHAIGENEFYEMADYLIADIPTSQE